MNRTTDSYLKKKPTTDTEKDTKHCTEEKHS